MEPTGKYEFFPGYAVYYLSPTVFCSASSDSKYVYGRVFATYLESIILVTGDLKMHVNDTNDPNTCELLDLLVSMGLKQHVKGSTHEEGHTLDLVITREHDDVIKSAPVIDRFTSDHAAVLCPLNSVKPLDVVKAINYRQLKAIDMDALRADLRDSDLCTTEFTDVDEMASCYNSTLQAILVKHAPLKTKTVVNRKRVRWFTSQMKAAIRARQKVERIWRKSKLNLHMTLEFLRRRKTMQHSS